MRLVHMFLLIPVLLITISTYITVDVKGPFTYSRKLSIKAKNKVEIGYEYEMERNMKEDESKIPHTLIFTYQYNILETRKPRRWYNNIKRTIETYSELWDDPSTRVIFLDDSECEKAIARVSPQLAPYFINEKNGVRRADLCRIAALYLYGGYYFDIDIEVVTPVVIARGKTFSTVIQPMIGDFFQAFIASTPQHPILKSALDYMRLDYLHNSGKSYFLGPETLKQAYDFISSSTGEQNLDDVLFLEEINLKRAHGQGLYSDVPLREGEGCCCNYAVHDPESKVLHFFSRMVGFSGRCHIKKSNRLRHAPNSTVNSITN